MEKLFNNLFNFKIENNLRISITKNEIYNQLLLYIFFSVQKDIIILTSNLNEANNIYINLKNYLDNVFIFPEDDYLTKKAIAVSPELLFLRLKLLNNLQNKNKKIVICHLNSFLKKLDNPNDYSSKAIKIKLKDKINRENIIEKLLNIGYKKETLVTNTGEFSIRGFVLDIFPIDEEHPYRIELFDDEVENIKSFNENTQLSTENKNELIVLPIKDDYENVSSTIIDYLDNPLVIVDNYNQILNAEENLKEQIRYYDEDFSKYFNLKDIKMGNILYIESINNGQGDYCFISEENKNYNENIKEFIKDIQKEKNSILFTTNKKLIDKIIENNINVKIIKEEINRGFKFNNIRYFSTNDLKKSTNKSLFQTNYKLGKRIQSIDKIKEGDYVVHKNSGIGVYMGIKVLNKNGVKKDYIYIKYKGNDKLYLPVEDINKLYKYSSKEGSKPKIHSLNSNEWKKTKLKIKGKIKEITNELINIYKNRAVSLIEPFNKENHLEEIFASEFEYEPTIDQIKSYNEIKSDMEMTKPMERLLCGDVGYGKTEVIFRSMFKAVVNEKQVMYLCPTTLLSHQQYSSALNRFKNFPINIAVLNRFTTKKEVKEILNKLKEKKIDIIFGTHRLLSGDLEFKDLGLVVIDEEQRFGVEHKEKIKKYKSNVHVLSVSATPIPRSLQMSLVGIRDLSLIETPPKNRYPVQTYVINYDERILREVVLKELARNGQVFILYNKIEDMQTLTEKYKLLIPEAKITYAHGSMSKEKIQDIMFDFVSGEYNVLISTTIIENGIDIPNANTIIIMDCDRFGLAQLYQIRGRVGRSDKIAYAYLMYEKHKILTETAVKRLNAIKEFTDLGSGYKIAMRDLSIRGAGDLLGREQAGFIDSVGVDMYLDLINEEINNSSEEKENIINLDDVSNHIDDKYSTEDEIIIELHQKINLIKNKEELNNLVEEIKDRFGFLDENLKLYIYQEYLESILNNLKIDVLSNTERLISLKITDKIYKSLNIEELFIKALQISTKFNFKYKNNFIEISIQKNNLEESYIYYLLKLLEYIQKQIKTTD
ncbi:MAG: transcription-repair coupling factor [Bacilli bacterium]|nr:transcription-repair coupling factor [Bacilli bacterium]